MLIEKKIQLQDASVRTLVHRCSSHEQGRAPGPGPAGHRHLPLCAHPLPSRLTRPTGPAVLRNVSKEKVSKKNKIPSKLKTFPTECRSQRIRRSRWTQRGGCASCCAKGRRPPRSRLCVCSSATCRCVHWRRSRSAVRCAASTPRATASRASRAQSAWRGSRASTCTPTSWPTSGSCCASGRSAACVRCTLSSGAQCVARSTVRRLTVGGN